MPESLGTFRTDNGMFVGLTIGVILIIGGLTFFPAISLGPVVEQLSHSEVLLMTTVLNQPTRPTERPRRRPVARTLRSRQILRQALKDSFRKLDPRMQVKNPVMFVVLVGSVITFIEAFAHPGTFTWSITVWLFLTVIFANFAEAMAEGRGKAQADTLRKMRSETEARRLRPDGTEELVAGGDSSPRATSSSARPATSSPPTARSSKASPRSTSRRSPVNPRRSSASPAATARR